jgi:DNA-binding IclR family transcriptional regulator
LKAAHGNRLKIQLTKTAETGIAYDLEESIEDIHELAAPGYDFTGDLRLELGIVAPQERLDHERMEECARMLLATARALSQDLGYGKSQPGL